MRGPRRKRVNCGDGDRCVDDLSLFKPGGRLEGFDEQCLALVVARNAGRSDSISRTAASD
jgi:hypothetical protein